MKQALPDINIQGGRKMQTKEMKKFKKDGLNEIARRCEQIANNRFSLRDKEWNLLLLFRDKLDNHIEKNYS